MYIFYKKLFTFTKVYAIMKLQRGNIPSVITHERQLPGGSIAGAASKECAPEPDVFAIGKRNESFDFRKTDDRTREP